jgi:hypothetical protein
MRRKDWLTTILASAPIEEEEVGWDEESSDEDEQERTTTPSQGKPASAPSSNLAASKETLKPVEQTPRRSNDEKSVADSDASYDLVSGATSRAPSRAPGSPQDKKKETVAEESDEEDWE